MKVLNTSYCSKERPNCFNKAQLALPIDDDESNTKTASISAYGGHCPKIRNYFVVTSDAHNFTQTKNTKISSEEMHFTLHFALSTKEKEWISCYIECLKYKSFQ